MPEVWWGMVADPRKLAMGFDEIAEPRRGEGIVGRGASPVAMAHPT